MGNNLVRNPELVSRLVKNYGQQVVIGIDARNGLVAIEGWTETSKVTALDLARDLADKGAARFIYTDISRDGTLTEPNYTAFAEFKAAAGRPVIASGGISRLEHLEKLKELGAEGAIIGKALYTGDIKFASIR